MEEQGSTKSLDLKSSEIGAEFKIPTHNHISPVESVLNDEAISMLTNNDLTDNLTISEVPLSFNSRSISTSLVNSSDVDTQTEQLPKCLKTIPDPQLMLSHTVLNHISNNILLFCDNYGAGQPSAIKFSLLIAIGTTEGFIIVFHSCQRYLWHHKAINCGAVSAIDFNYDCSRLLVGYINGTIILFDSSFTTCKLLLIMNDVHIPHTAVLHLKFTDLPNLAIISNSAGSVFELKFKRRFGKFGMWNVESKRFFSGHPSKVYCIEPLLLNQLSCHPMHGYVIIAMATLSKIIIYALRPNTELLLSHDVIPSGPCSPLLSWLLVATQFKKMPHLSHHQIVNPVLVLIQYDTIYFYVVKLNENNSLCCNNMQKIVLPFKILACSWMNHRTVLIISSLNKVHLIDVLSKHEIEQFDLLNFSLIFISSFYDGSDFPQLAECCYSSIHSHNGQLIFLSNNNVNIICVRNWTDYLDNLTEKKLFINALQLGVDFLEKRSKPIYDMRISQAPVRKIVEEKVIDIVALYIDSMIEVNDPINYEEGIPIVMDVSIFLKKTDILFDRLWHGVELFESSCKMFLKCLMNYLCNDQINEVPTFIIQKLFTYLFLTNQFKKLEKCILNVKVKYLDIDQSIKLVRAHSLYDGLISIWTRALQDYTTPLLELVPKIEITNGEYSNFTIGLGNIILNYLRSCLLGIAYPYSGDIPEDLQDKVKRNIVQFLCSQHSIKPKDDEYIYPYLRILLKFNTTKFLNILTISNRRFSSQQKQRIICILSSIITNNKDLKSNQLGYIYAFIVKWQQEENYSIKLDKNVFETVVTLLTSPEQTTPLEERKKILTELFDLGEFNNDPNLFTTMVEKSKFNSVCGPIYSENGKFGQKSRYLLDDVKKHKMFEFIKSKPEFLEHLTYDHIKEVLSDIDTVKCEVTFDKMYEQHVCDISKQIKINHHIYPLKGAMVNVKVCTNELEWLCQYEPGAKINVVEKNNSLRLKTITATRTVELDNVINMLFERLANVGDAFKLLLIKLKEFIQQENSTEECMEILVSLPQRGSYVLDSKSTFLSILQFLVQSHDHTKISLNSNDFKLTPEIRSLLNCPRDPVGSSNNHMIGIDKCQYKFQLLKSPQIVHHGGQYNLLDKVINKEKHCLENPMICSIYEQKCINVPTMILRFHSDCSGVHTACTFYISTDDNM